MFLPRFLRWADSLELDLLDLDLPARRGLPDCRRQPAGWLAVLRGQVIGLVELQRQRSA